MYDAGRGNDVGRVFGSGMFGFMIAFVLMFYLWAREHPEDL
jgi:hypothetical protein